MMRGDSSRGYFAIGIYNGKSDLNLGTLWRTAMNLGAAFVFTVLARYTKVQRSDTLRSHRHMPLLHFDDIEDLFRHMPFEATLVAVEESPTVALPNFAHPESAVYLLGAEDIGLPEEIINRCNMLVAIPSFRSLNVAVAGGLVMYDRALKRSRRPPCTDAL